MVLSSLNYYTHHISPHTIPPKMTKLFSKLKLTKLFYISPQQNLFIPFNKLSYFPIAQETITITGQTRIVLKNKLSYSPVAQETIIIIDLTRKDLKNKLSYSQNPQETITIIGPARIILKNKLSYFPIAQETIIITSPPVDMTRKTITITGLTKIPLNKLSYSQ